MGRTLVLSRIYPPEIGGSGRWMHELYRRLPRRDFVVIAGECHGDEAFDQQHAEEIDIRRAPLDFASWGASHPRNLRAYLRMAGSLKKLVKREQVARLHAACCLPEGLLAWVVAKRLGISYSVYVHGEELNVAASSRELSWLARRVFRGAEMVIANSQNTADLLRDGWVPAGVEPQVLHPGVDAEAYCPAPRDEELRKRLGWAGKQVVLTVGRLQKRKGHDMLIRALPRILRDAPDMVYAIVGDGDERQALASLAESLGVGHRVFFHGAMHDDQLREAFQQCDLFALPNRDVGGDTEGFGIVLLEAQACGKPVIAGDSGGTRETLIEGETGRIVDGNSPEAIAEAILSILCDGPWAAAMGQAAREWIVDHFDWPALADRAEALFVGSQAGAQKCKQAQC